MNSSKDGHHLVGTASAANAGMASDITYKTDISEDKEKLAKIAKESVLSLQSCYKVCFAAVLANVTLTIVDNDVSSKLFGSENNLSWGDIVDIFNSFSLLIFAIGIRRIHTLLSRRLIYIRSQIQGGKRVNMGENSLLSGLRMTALMWRTNALNFAAMSLSTAYSLVLQGKDGPFRFIFQKIGPSSLTMAVCILLFAVTVVVREYCSRSAKRALENDKEMMKSIRKLNNEKTNEDLVAAYDLGRYWGYKTYRNQSLCAGNYAILGSLELVKWIVEPNSGGVLGRLLTVSDVVEPFVITILLVEMSKKYLKAGISRTRYASVSEIDDQIYHDFFLAQSGFYGKVADTIKGATIFRLLPYVVSPFMPYILSLAKSMAPTIVDRVMEFTG